MIERVNGGKSIIEETKRERERKKREGGKREIEGRRRDSRWIRDI